MKKKGELYMKENRKKKVILADRDGFYLQRLKRCLERKGDMEVVGMTDNGQSLVEEAKKLQPDVILMDILLGDRDGFWVLEELKKKEIDCVCIMISAIDSDKLVRKAIALGADYYMAKPIQGELLMERMYQLLEVEPMQSGRPIREEKALQSEEERLHQLETEISILLSRMGISASIRGYHFVRRAVIMVVEDPGALTGITKGLYPDIGKLYKTNAGKVERAIRHAIESAWKKNGPQVYYEVAGYLPPEKPTNGQFIAVLSEYFRMNNGQRPQKIS